jgi:hypothetical protein
MRFMLGLVVSAAVLAGCQQPAPAPPADAKPAAPAQSPVERGKYLTLVGGCNDCHTPKKFDTGVPEYDMSKELSGHPSDAKLPKLPAKLVGPGGWGTIANDHLTAWVTPAGTAFAMNLTSDKATGVGSWSEQTFVDAIRLGKHQGTGRAILPPMPWNWYKNMTDEDLKAVFAYLQSLPPINNPIPDPLPPGTLP